MATGLFIGRFQPFHKGHLAIIKKAMQHVDTLLIVLGSSQISRTAENPLTPPEREIIIRETLHHEGIRNFRIYPVEDIDDDAKYVAHVEKKVPPFDIVFSGENKLITKLFSTAGYPVIDSKRLGNWIATDIRGRIKQNKDFTPLVPGTVKAILKKEKLVEVIRDS